MAMCFWESLLRARCQKLRNQWFSLFFLMTFTLTVSEAQFDGDIYMVSVEETQAILKRLQVECAQNRSMDVHDARFAGSPHCFAEFDSIMCWPTTPANETVHLPCPSYIGGVSVTGKAWRSCEYIPPGTHNYSNRIGQWLFDATNYSECVEIDRDLHLEFLNIIGHIGYTTSVLSLTVAIGIMLRFRRLRCTRNRVHINLFSAIILRGVCHFLQIVNFETAWICKAVTVLNTYTIEATYSWVFVEALFLHNTVLVHVMNDSSISLAVYISIGWVTPLLVTFVWVLLRIYVTPGPECWILDVGAVSSSRLLLIIYPSVMILLNGAFFVSILRVIFVKMQSQPTSEANRLRTILRSTLVLVIIFGIYHMIFIPLDLMHSPQSTFQPKIMEFAQLYYRQVMESFQGFLVSLLLCFLNKEVTSEIKRIYRRTHPRSMSIDPGNRGSAHKEDHAIAFQSGQLTIATELGRRSSRKSQMKQPRKFICIRKRFRRNSAFIQPVGPRRPSPLCQQNV
ncbi:Parathyroid hormone/parathyroid hormone peptide receptor [Fasciola hepatica]|uniref:Parathyroid hormone/parathyroid hormone peptide receptor n=1 Tax=Fasciola hepatica TaxID=6192 RepID=A0A4E0RXW4_FASHE|nr:Parathyroid hormone/parathyroid hormone peptide receptor [Fasciola hepatica]